MKKKLDSIKKLLKRDVKEFNGFVLVFVSILILVISGLLSYLVTNSYALFSDSLKGEKVIEVTASNCKNNPNKPVLSENMIPVYYDETNDVWRKADSTNRSMAYQWYDYCEKMWANAVTVSATSTETTLTLDDGSTTNCSGDTCVRSDYVDAELGTVIPMDDILTMQVWIPRYKYTVWNYNLDGTVTSEPQEISIEFEEEIASTGEITCEDNVQGTSDGTASGTEPTTSEICKLKSTGAECTDSSCNGKTYNHPAFTFGDKELEGFWVGKFEVSSDNTTCVAGTLSAVGAGCNLTTIKPLIKPNVSSWRGAMVGTYENNMMAMNDGSNIYGFATTDDTHMIKNMEWGAVAYLSHSKYGINKEIALNSNSSYTTGCGPQSEGSTSSGSTCNAYNTSLGQSASTTGNIYGVYDMSGGAYEYVMGNIVSPDGAIMMSGYQGSNNSYSGYTGIVYYGSSSGDYLSYTGYYGNYPEDKYYDKYSFNTSNSTRGRSKLGDGIREVLNTSSYGWYSDFSSLLRSNDPWFGRGGYCNRGIYNGAFSSGTNYSGYALTSYSSRLVISQ